MKTSKLKTIIIILISLIAVTSLVFSCACKKEVVLNETELTFLNLVNDARIENNLNPLTPSQKLMDIAGSRCSDMATRNYFSHWTLEGKRVKQGEILGRSNIDIGVEKYIKAWLQSPIHKEVILNPKYKNIGIGIIDDNRIRIVTIIFSSR